MFQKIKRIDTEICSGCSKASGWIATGWVCSVYANKHKTYGYRMGECAFNMDYTGKIPVTRKARVGQQKQKKGI